MVIPQVLPYLLSAIRFALGVGWKTATIAELIGLSTGVGYELNYWFGLFNMRQVLAWTLTFTLVLLIFEFAIFKPVEISFCVSLRDEVVEFRDCSAAIAEALVLMENICG